eukprot:3977060-Pyramimonas_sp.AAC.1
MPHDADYTPGLAPIQGIRCRQGEREGWYPGEKRTHKRGEPQQQPPWAQGGLPHRCRENSIATIMTTVWKAEQHGYSTVFTNYDCSNAFASTH